MYFELHKGKNKLNSFKHIFTGAQPKARLDTGHKMQTVSIFSTLHEGLNGGVHLSVVG